MLEECSLLVIDNRRRWQWECDGGEDEEGEACW